MVLWVNGQAHVSPLSGAPSGAIRRVMASPCLSACRPSLLAPSWARCGIGPLWRWGYWEIPDRHGVATCRIGKMRWASWPLDAGSGAPSQPTRSHRLTVAPSRTSQPRASPLCVTTLQSRLHRCSTPTQLFQIPPDLVVKSQTIDITKIILSRSRRPNAVQTLCRNRISRFEQLSTSEAHWSTTKSDGMCHFQHLATAAALNLVRLGEWLTGTPRVKTRCSPFAALKAA
jgi:hypothetical protein